MEVVYRRLPSNEIFLILVIINLNLEDVYKGEQRAKSQMKCWHSLPLLVLSSKDSGLSWYLVLLWTILCPASPAQMLPSIPKVHHSGNHELDARPTPYQGLSLSWTAFFVAPRQFGVKQWDVGENILFCSFLLHMGRSPLSHCPFTRLLHKYHYPFSLAPIHDFKFWVNLM